MTSREESVAEQCWSCGADLAGAACAGHERRTLIDIVFETVEHHGRRPDQALPALPRRDPGTLPREHARAAAIRARHPRLGGPPPRRADGLAQAGRTIAQGPDRPGGRRGDAALLYREAAPGPRTMGGRRRRAPARHAGHPRRRDLAARRPQEPLDPCLRRRRHHPQGPPPPPGMRGDRGHRHHPAIPGHPDPRLLGLLSELWPLPARPVRRPSDQGARLRRRGARPRLGQAHAIPAPRCLPSGRPARRQDPLRQAVQGPATTIPNHPHPGQKGAARDPAARPTGSAAASPNPTPTISRSGSRPTKPRSCASPKTRTSASPTTAPSAISA